MTAPVVGAIGDVEPTPRAASIGFFDGVHRGHRTIIRRAMRAARRDGSELPTAAVTFDRHPLATVRPEAVPSLLTTDERRFALLAGSGVDLVVPLPFDEEMARMSPEDFVGEILVGRLGVTHVAVGANFRFGRRAAGDVGTLSRLGAEHGFVVDTVDLLGLAGETISSTAVRERLAEGDIRWAARALGRYPTLEGPVVAGDRRGRDLGFPTANVAVAEAIQLPALGVYAAFAHLPDADVVPAAVSIGTRPQFDGRDVRVEAHLLDWDGDLYGAELQVELRRYLRGEQRFDDVDGLVAQMDEDVARTRSIVGRSER